MRKEHPEPAPETVYRLTTMSGMKRQRGCGNPDIRPEMPEEDAERLAMVFHALADPTRVQIISLLASHPEAVCACDIVANFDLEQPTIAHHLRVLREAGLVDSERHGIWAYYHLRPEGLAAARRFCNIVAP